MVSCIVTTYKRPIEILKRALDSVVNQTYQDIEMIVVNDAPQEAALAEEIGKLVDTYRIPVRYIVQERNQGACEARNTGITYARGEYLAFLDDDDEWLPQKLEIQLAYMQKETTALVYCSHYVIDKYGRKRLIEEPLAREGHHKDEFEQLLKVNFIGSTSYPLLRTEAVKDVGGFTVGLRASQDHDLWLRLARKFDIVYCREPLVILHYSREAISRNPENSIQGYEYLLERYAKEYKEQPKIWNYRLNYVAFCCALAGKWKYFIRYQLRAVKVKPVSKNNFMMIEMLFKKLTAEKRMK